MGHEGFNFLQRHPFLDGTLHADQAHAVLVLNQFTNSSDTSITEVIDIIPVFQPILDTNQVLYPLDNILFRQGSMVNGGIKAKFGVYFVSAYLGQIICGGIKKQLIKKCLRNLRRWRAGRTKSAVNFNLRPRTNTVLYLLSQSLLQLISRQPLAL